MAIVRAKLTGGTPITTEIAVVSCKNFLFVLYMTMVLFGFSFIFLGVTEFRVYGYLKFIHRVSGRDMLVKNCTKILV